MGPYSRRSPVVFVLLAAQFGITTTANVALNSQCTTDTGGTRSEQAVDGIVSNDGNFWKSSTFSPGNPIAAADVWIELTFPSTFFIASGRIMQIWEGWNQAKDIELTFSDGTTVQVTLTVVDGSWDDFSFTPVVTSSVRITIRSVVVPTAVNVKMLEVEFFSDGTPLNLRLWRHENDSLSNGVSSSHAASECAILVAGDFLEGALFIVMETADSFNEVNFTIKAPGMRVEFSPGCNDNGVPAAVMTMDLALGRFATDACQPTCGAVARCSRMSTVDFEHEFNCRCSTALCQDVGLHIPPQAFLFDNETMYICQPMMKT